MRHKIERYIKERWNVKEVIVTPCVISSQIDVNMTFEHNLHVRCSVNENWGMEKCKDMIDAAIKDHVWKAFESKETILKLYPVCDCGHVFKNFKMNTYSPTCEYFDETKVRLPSSSKFSPAICPKCGKTVIAVCSKYPDKTTGEWDFDY